MSEFNLIKTHFTWKNTTPGTALSVGDDAALLEIPEGAQLVVSVDTSISGVHFPENTHPHAIGYKALAVNLSDLAAMGAKPRWFTLALTLPKQDNNWLQAFSTGMRELTEQHNIALVGGDTTRGPLSITIQIMGTVPKDQALLRSAAQTGDLICISGTPGDAAAGLSYLQQGTEEQQKQNNDLIQRLNYPTPRVQLGLELRGLAHACIDVSDGLLADLQHILNASGKGANLRHQQLPFSPALNKLPLEQKVPLALTGGDDYELLFTLAPDKLARIEHAAQKTATPVTVIGEITKRSGHMELDYPLPDDSGYNHFRV